MTKFTFTAQGKSDEVLLFGLKICEEDWLYLGQEIDLYDSRFKKELTFGIYQIEIKGEYYVFAAHEIADDEWIFYTQIQ